MSLFISDTFTFSLAKLTVDEQKAVKTTAFDLQLNPESPGRQFHRLLRAKDPNFRSVRVNLDIRLIVHKTAASLLLCYVYHHDAAYRCDLPGFFGPVITGERRPQNLLLNSRF